MSAQAAAVAQAYFAAVAARDVEGMLACWAPGGRENIRGQLDTTASSTSRRSTSSPSAGGLIQEDNAFSDAITFARQIGMLPAEGSKTDRLVLKAFNAKSRLAARLECTGVEAVADGVWRLRGGIPKRSMNVYLVTDDDGGVLAFDAGIRRLAGARRAAARRLAGALETAAATT